MPRVHQVYVESGQRRVFAGAIDWPGWCRSGRNEDSALEALVAYGRRYKSALGKAASGFVTPAHLSEMKVVERLEGNAGTDFGAPSMAPAADDRPLDAAELQRLTTLLMACWKKFDRTAENAAGLELRKGPRGGGRELDAIKVHVMEADGSYLMSFGGRTPKDGDVRGAILDLLASLGRGEPPPRVPRSGRLWTPRYAVRRSAWHVLDHTWEIEDRAIRSR